VSARWVSEVELRAAVGGGDARALLEEFGGLSIYVPRVPACTNTLGRNLLEILSWPGYVRLTKLCGGETIRLPNLRRRPAALEAHRLLAEGKSARQVADALCISLRYVERLSRLRARAGKSPQQYSLL
jgi:hypothetical protein